MTASTKEYLRQSVNQIRDMLPYIKPQERVNLFSEISRGYCDKCGDKEPEGGHCNCENDE